MESTSQAVATTASANSAMPTSVAPQSAAPSGMSQQAALPGITSGPGTGSPGSGGGRPAGGQSMAGGVSGPERKLEYKQPLPGPGTVLGVPNADASGQYPGAMGFGKPQTQQQAPYSAQAIYSPQASTQAYSEAEVASLLQQQAASLQQSAPAASDAYLSQISDESLEVLEHFGAEAPTLLNTYACAVEDALIEQVQRGQSMSLMLEAAGEERAAMNLMLTDPDVLADYVNDFYGPNGPYPTPTEAEARARQQQARAQFEAEIIAQEQGNVPQSFQRPEMDMPTPGRQVNEANDFWGGFSQMMDQNPENAWQYLSQAPQGALSAKMLVQDV